MFCDWLPFTIASRISHHQMITIYIDGGTLRNGDDNSPAALGCFFIKTNDQGEQIHWRLLSKQLVGSNNVAELCAAICALESLNKRDDQIQIISDSQYVINGAGQWVHHWSANGWATAGGKPVANQHLWRSLLLLKPKEIKWRHVRGHVGVEGNELVDYACTLAMKADAQLDMRGADDQSAAAILNQLKRRYPHIKKR